ncbi:MAG: ferrous iron transport protein B [Rikenellaceae bacterium]
MKRLSELKDGDVAIITNIVSSGEYTKRLIEMGFVNGRTITVVKNAPLKDPIEYDLMGYSISLRRKEAQQIEVILESELRDNEKLKSSFDDFSPKLSTDFGKKSSRSNDTINVALVGNPNCGKTSLFNYISGLKEHVGNYSGVTVDIKEATIKHNGYNIKITDLPGVYSISAYSPEEKIVKKELSLNKYDYIINVIDSTLLERNLYLTTQLMDMACHMVISLNMYDELQGLGDKFNHELLGKMLDIPLIPTNARSGEGVSNLLDMIVAKYSNELPHTHVESNLGIFIEDRLSKLSNKIESLKLETHLPKRFVAIGLICGDTSYIENTDDSLIKLSNTLAQEIDAEYSKNSIQALADARYGYISGALKETLTVESERSKQSRDIDSVLTHKFWGFPIFLAMIWLMFYVTFTVGAYPMDWIDAGVGLLSDYLNSAINDGAIKDLVVDGIIGGVGSVIIFLPNILILFLFISILEDTGYMSRAAFIMDRMMHRIGLHGKSFVPLIMGFGCNVPAIMATRIIEDKNNRLLTTLIVPFMSCSARLPVYILLIGAFFPSYPSLVLMGLYLLGIIMAILTSVILKKFYFKGADHPFVMELPPYRMPLMRNTIKHMWNKSGQYLKKMGGIILVGAVVIWALGYYPSRQDSYLERIGHTIEPTIAPLGFDWKMGVSLISGVAAKEIVISTLGVLHNIEDSEDDQETETKLKEQLHRDVYSSGKHKGEKIFTTPTTLSFLVFVLLYFPCLAVIAAIKRESGSWKWAIFSLFYTTAIAWITSFIVYNVARYFVG